MLREGEVHMGDLADLSLPCSLSLSLSISLSVYAVLAVRRYCRTNFIAVAVVEQDLSSQNMSGKNLQCQIASFDASSKGRGINTEHVHDR